MKVKIAVFIFLVSAANIFATRTYSQVAKVTLNMENKTLEQVMDEIEKQSEFYFIFNQKQIDINRVVSIQADKKLIEEVLPDLFSGVEVIYTVFDRKILLTTDSIENLKTNMLPIPAFQQNVVTGKVTDSQTGEAMPGVNIRVSGTTVGAITDAEGKYSISVPDANAILIFSFIGYNNQEVPVGGRSIVDLRLEPELTGLSEVVVYGYGTVQKQSLTGSISAIKAADIVTTRTNSIATMVQGKIPGLMIRKRTGEPGTFNSFISVRGFGTPLLVIDGVVRDGMSDFERINPQDIESISVLKDASAAIYGMNADNGVLIVTTKSGTKGTTKINFNSTYSLKIPTVQGYQNSVDAYTYRVMKNEMLRNYQQVEQFTAAELEKWKAGTEPGYTDYNWYKEFQRPSIGAWDHNLSLTGGTDVITHYTSIGVMNDDGLYYWNSTLNYEKYNFRTAFDAQIVKGLRLSMKVAGKYDKRMNPPQSYFWIFKQMLVSDRGTGPYTLATKDLPQAQRHYSTVPSENVNVWAKVDPNADGYVRQRNYQYQLSGEINYEVPFIKGLSLNVLGAFDSNIQDNTTFRGSFTLYDYRTDAPLSPTQASLNERMYLFLRTNVQGKIVYKNTFAGAHNVSGLLVSELRQLSTKDIGGYRQYDQIYTHDILDQASTTNQTTRGGLNRQAYVSYLGRFNYDYKGKYLAEFAFREDGSYRYAPSQRWAFFPSGSIGWRISEESFIRNNLPVISNLKIRASYGIMGADAGSAFQYVPGYSLSSIAGGYIVDPGVLTFGMIPPGVINDNLSWVEAKTTDIGIDLSVWKNKLGLTADVFQKERTGLLATRASSVPNTFGASFPQENLNGDRVRGLELEVSHRGRIRDINYNVSANVTYSRTYYLHRERSPYQSTWDQWKNGSDGDGRIQGRKWGYQQEGIYTDITQYETAVLIGGTRGNAYCLPGTQIVKDVNGDGRISGDDQLPVYWEQNVNPPLQYGATLAASWKGFDINMLLQGAALFTLTMPASASWGYITFPTMWDFWLDRWYQADPSVNPYDPAAVWIQGKYAPLQSSWTGTNQGVNTEQWIWPCTYLRIKNLDIGYNLPNKLTNKAFLKDVRLSLGIVNLATFCKKDLKIFDPEKESGASNAELTYPLLREWNFSLSVNF